MILDAIRCTSAIKKNVNICQSRIGQIKSWWWWSNYFGETLVERMSWPFPSAATMLLLRAMRRCSRWSTSVSDEDRKAIAASVVLLAGDSHVDYRCSSWPQKRSLLNCKHTQTPRNSTATCTRRSWSKHHNSADILLLLHEKMREWYIFSLSTCISLAIFFDNRIENSSSSSCNKNTINITTAVVVVYI